MRPVAEFFAEFERLSATRGAAAEGSRWRVVGALRERGLHV